MRRSEPQLSANPRSLCYFSSEFLLLRAARCSCGWKTKSHQITDRKHNQGLQNTRLTRECKQLTRVQMAMQRLERNSWNVRCEIEGTRAIQLMQENSNNNNKLQQQRRPTWTRCKADFPNLVLFKWLRFPRWRRKRLGIYSRAYLLTNCMIVWANRRSFIFTTDGCMVLKENIILS